MDIWGSTYPVPPLNILNSVIDPPDPTLATIVAANPTCEVSVTATETLL